MLKNFKPRTGILGTAHSYIASDTPARTAGVDVVDMQCAAETRVCYQLEKPYTAIKVVADCEVGEALTSCNKLFSVICIDPRNNRPMTPAQAQKEGIQLMQVMVCPNTGRPLKPDEIVKIKERRKKEQLAAMAARQKAWQEFMPTGPARLAGICCEFIWNLDLGIREYYIEMRRKKEFEGDTGGKEPELR